MAAEMEEEAAALSRPGARHIKKRALKNKALSVSFNEKDLRDYVGGFHKRKKKRRKEAEHQLQEVQRRKRIEARKKRKLERDSAYGEAPPTDSGPDDCGEDDEQDEGSEPVTSISGTTTYDNGDMKVIVTTCEISHEGDKCQTEKPHSAMPRSIGEAEKKHNVPVSKKKPFKRVAKHKSRPKSQNKRDGKKGKKKNKRTR